MKMKLIAVTVILLSILLLTGCECKHEWVEADCYTPKTCSKCGITEGEPRQHVPGEWIEAENIPYDRIYSEQFCTECGLLLQSEGRFRDSYVSENEFLFTPNDFLEKLEKLAKEYYPDFSYEIQASNRGDVINAALFFNEEKEISYLVNFCNEAGEIFTLEDLNANGVWYVSLINSVTVGSEWNSEYANLFDSDFLMSFYMACDPIFTEDDYKVQNSMRFLSYIDWRESGESVRRYEINGLLYEFYHTEIGDTYAQQIGIYASNFMK